MRDSRTLLASAVLLAFAFGAAAAQDAMPSAERAAEKRAVAYLDALATGDSERALAALEQQFDPAWLERDDAPDWTELSAKLARGCAGMQVHRILFEDGARLVVEAEGSEGGSRRFEFGFRLVEPHFLFGIAVQRGGGGPGSGLPALELPTDDAKAVDAALHEYLSALAAKDGFSGVVGIAYDGEPRFRRAYGLADRTHEIPNRVTTRFDVGSITKDFTKLAIARLWIDGQLTPDDSIGTHLPDYPNADVARTVTIRQLLDHSAGIPDIFNERFFESAKRLYRTATDYFPLFAEEPLDFEPGTESRYSNGGYEILGAIIEAASGMPYEAYVSKIVFEPAGMTSSGFFARDDVVPDVAMGYTTKGRSGPVPLHANLFHLPVKGSPSGGSFSPIDDLLAFDRALRGHTLTPEPFTRWLLGGPLPGAGALAEARRAGAQTSGAIPAGDGAAPSLAGSMDGVGTIMAGGAPGVNSSIQIEGPWTVIVLANLDPPIATGLGERISNALRN